MFFVLFGVFFFFLLSFGFLFSSAFVWFGFICFFLFCYVCFFVCFCFYVRGWLCLFFCFVFCFEGRLWQMSLGFLQVMSLDSSLQTVTQQNARLNSDLRITQQERDALKQEVLSLHKRLHAANEKVSIEDPSFCH